MNWYEIEWQDLGMYLDSNLPKVSIEENTKQIFTIYRDKFKDIDSTIMRIDGDIVNKESNSISDITLLKSENDILKKLIRKMARKDYPELLVEHPEFFDEKVNECNSK